MSPFIGKLLSSTLLRSCLVFNFSQFVILENLSIFGLGTVKSKKVNLNRKFKDEFSGCVIKLFWFG